jgi:hypothetical protein
LGQPKFQGWAGQGVNPHGQAAPQAGGPVQVKPELTLQVGLCPPLIEQAVAGAGLSILLPEGGAHPQARGKARIKLLLRLRQLLLLYQAIKTAVLEVAIARQGQVQELSQGEGQGGADRGRSFLRGWIDALASTRPRDNDGGKGEAGLG